MKLLFAAVLAIVSLLTILRQSEALQGFGDGTTLIKPTKILPEGIPKSITQQLYVEPVQSTIKAAGPVESKSSTKMTISASFQTIR